MGSEAWALRFATLATTMHCLRVEYGAEEQRGGKEEHCAVLAVARDVEFVSRCDRAACDRADDKGCSDGRGERAVRRAREARAHLGPVRSPLSRCEGETS